MLLQVKWVLKGDSDFSHVEIPGTTTEAIVGIDGHESLNGVA